MADGAITRHDESRPEGADGADSPALEQSSSASLVVAMRRQSHDAFREFFARYSTMLEVIARARRVPAAEREALVTEFLDDAAMRLALHTTPVPRSLASYLAISFRRWHLNRARDARRRDELDAQNAIETGAGGERVVPGASSSAALRASCGEAIDGQGLSPTIEQLALAIENGLYAKDRQLLEWLGQRVPQRTIAEWLGTTHGALRVRVSRLRHRLRMEADAHIARLAEPERREIERFLRGGGASPARSGTHARPWHDSAVEGQRRMEESDER